MARRVSFAPQADADLFGLYSYIAERNSLEIAAAYVERAQDYCLGFGIFPERGFQRDDIRPGLRTIGFERRVTIVFHISADGTIDRVAYGGRSIGALFDPDA